MTISINGRKIGANFPPYVIAEISGNHNGQLARALKLVEAAKSAGADAVKMQTYTADTITIDHGGPEFRIESGPWAGKTLYELYDQAHTPWDWHEPLFLRAKELGLTIFSSPFDNSAVDFLENLRVPAYKIASFELLDIPLIEKIAGTGKPLIMSTGMADFDEIERALNAARGSGANDIVLLHCVSGYPTPPKEANLQTLRDLAEKFKIDIGLSDHTMGTAVSIAAVALGASVIEKHFTMARSDGGPDSSFSLEPNELAELVNGCKNSWEAIGKVYYGLKPSEKENVNFRRSLFAVENISSGELFTARNVRSIRPGHGLHPASLPLVLGKVAARNILRGTPLNWGDIEK